MLPTFVIGLREGLEAALIVGIIAAFIVKSGRPEALRPMFIGVSLAIAICAAFAIVLRVIESNLPQKQQEGLETVLGVAAVVTISYMIVWMKRNARNLKAELETKAATALGSRSTQMLVMMAFLAVLREGIETSVFLLASFNSSSNPKATGTGAILGILLAFALGYFIYKGGVRLNLSKFFRVTGFVLALVAAGLLSTALHTAHEAGWFNSYQTIAFDLHQVVKPGSVRSALLTGGLGIQTEPTVGEAVLWVAYAVPMALFVIWPAKRRTNKSPRAQLVTA